MNQINTTPIERVKNISKQDFIKNYYKPQRPVIIENLTREWGAYDKWYLNYIQEKAGEQIIPLYDNKSAKGKQSVYAPVKEMRLYDYIELLKTEPTDLRIFFYNILDSMPELLNDFKYPDIGLKFFKRLPALFFGGSDSKVFMHYDIDLPDSLHFHFHGNKRIVLFSQEQSKFLYKIPFSIHNIDKIDMDKPDFKTYPALQYVKGIEANLKHGETLYMPSGYWHSIRYLDCGFSMTLRALPKKPKKFINMLYNILIMRHFDNLMRKFLGQKWLDYKENLALKRTHKAMVRLK